MILQKTVKTQTLQIYLIMLTAYLCCFATSSHLLANPLNSVDKSTKNKQYLIDFQKELKSSRKELKQFIFTKNICSKLLPRCLKAKDIVIERKYLIDDRLASEDEMLAFPYIINLKKIVKLSGILNFSKIKQKHLVQQVSFELNKLSSSWFIEKHSVFLNENNLSVNNIAINNSIIISQKNNFNLTLEIPLEFDNQSNQTVSNLVVSNQITIGILDSGVSIYHQQMNHVDVIQYNPLDRTFALRDTALGHASGILSLMSVRENSEIESGMIENGQYFSCNGLPKGKYNYQLIIQCMNWFFLQPKVDVIINAWLASEPGCKNEWQQPIEALLASSIIPIFSAGNYALSKKGMNYSPANLVLDNLDYPLLTVGALNKLMGRLSTSSYGLSSCENSHKFKHYQANIFAIGEDLKVAIPLTKNTYQMASGTSYSIVEIASLTVKLIKQFPRKSNKDIIDAILFSARPQDTADTQDVFGYGVLNLQRSIDYLKNFKQDAAN